MRTIVTIAAILALSACATTPPADQVILNATIITMDPDNPRAEALAIRDGVFAAVGTNEQAEKHVGPTSKPSVAPLAPPTGASLLDVGKRLGMRKHA